MSIDKINHYSITNPASIYDEESLTALELAGRTAQKVNETVNHFNSLEQRTAEKLSDMTDKQIPETVEKKFNEYVGSGAIQDEINRYTSDLEGRVDNLLGSYIEGSTQFDAEIIDARTDTEGNVATNLGTRLRTLDNKALKVRPNPASLDANDLTDVGLWFVSSGSSWKNVPSAAGMLITYHDNTNLQGHCYQMFIESGLYGVYIRNNGKSGGAFWDWYKIETAAEIDKRITSALTSLKYEMNYNTSKYKVLTKTSSGVYDIDSISDNAFYFISSAENYTTLPTGENSGLLMCWKGSNEHNKYQMLHTYTGNLYIRNYIMGVGFSEWKHINKPVNVVSDTSERYELERIDSTTIRIWEKGKKGFISYDLKSMYGTIGLYGIKLYTPAKTLYKEVCGVGHDIEGVVLDDDGQIFAGGVHGSESLNANKIVINGVSYTFTELLSALQNNTISTNCIAFYKQALINNGDHINYGKNETIVFDENGVSIKTLWNCYDEEYTTLVYGGMMSVYDSCCNTYTDTMITPFLQPTSEPTTAGRIVEFKDENRVEYFGKDVHITHTFKAYPNYKYGQAFVDVPYEYKLEKYADRIKSYFIVWLDSYEKTDGVYTSDTMMCSTVKIDY